MARLNLLGGVVVEADGGARAIGSRRHPIALLALLATWPGHALGRSRLAGLLWPDTPEKTARNRLTSCIWDVRSSLGEDVLVSAGDDVRFDPAAMPCDVCLFEDALAAGRHAEAAGLYRGPFLDGFSIPGSPPFEQRTDLVRDRLREEYHCALEALARDAEARRDLEEAVRRWRERVRAEPWDSRVVRALMEALANAGSPAEALRAARDHERIVREEFGAEPAAELRALTERIQGGGPRTGVAPGVDLEAYRIYAQGRGLLDQRTPREMARSIDYFRRAIDRDPAYALAWAGLADAVSMLEFYDQPVPPSAPAALDAARRAVELAPDLGQARSALGIAHSIRRHGSAALRELEAAVDLAPAYAEAHAWLGWVRLLRGEAAEALHPAGRAVALDPLAPAYRVYFAEILLANSRAADALREAVRARDLQPGYGLAHYIEGLVLHHIGRLDEADAALQRALERAPPGGSPAHAEVRATLAVVRCAMGDTDAARDLLASVRRAGHAFSEGLVLAALGETDAAFDAFTRVTDWTSFANDHARYFFPDVLGPLHADARFGALLEAVDGVWRGAG